MPDFTTQAVLMISIGVGIDYALFIVTRYREALESGRDPESAVVVALDTAGRAVLFAGIDRRHRAARPPRAQHRDFRGVAIGTAIGVLVDDARLGHAAPRAARLRRPQHRPLRPPPPQAARRRRVVLAPVGRVRPEAPLARVPRRARAADRDRAPGLLAAARLRRRRQQARPATPAARRTTCSPRASGPASTDRCCSRPRRPAARPTSPC